MDGSVGEWVGGLLDGCVAVQLFNNQVRGLIECAHVRHPAKSASPAMAAALPLR
jgi:hypothetical protein